MIPDRPVHPHVRGAYEPINSISLLICGSSPRAWGLRISFHSIIRVHPVHPHVRGAYSLDCFIMDFSSGSSPRAWGLRHFLGCLICCYTVHPHVRGAYGNCCRVFLKGFRFIPTCVGLTLNPLICKA